MVKSVEKPVDLLRFRLLAPLQLSRGERVPHYSLSDFVSAFRLSPEVAAEFTQGAQSVGIT